MTKQRGLFSKFKKKWRSDFALLEKEKTCGNMRAKFRVAHKRVNLTSPHVSDIAPRLPRLR